MLLDVSQTIARCVKIVAKLYTLKFSTLQSTVAEIEVSEIWVEGIICWLSDYTC